VLGIVVSLLFKEPDAAKGFDQKKRRMELGL
jgi:hypothetical protein